MRLACERFSMGDEGNPKHPSFLDFLKAFVSSWLTGMSGAISVPLTAAGIFTTSPWLKAGFIIIGATCALLAAFGIWREERFARTKAERSLAEQDNNFFALQIGFDRSNPRQEYWSREQRKNPAKKGEWIVYKECRVKIENLSRATVRDVTVSSRPIGPLPSRPALMLFDATKTTKCDIHPGNFALVPVVQWPVEIMAGMACNETAAQIYGPIEVTATGTDVATVTRLFEFDWQLEPMIYD